MAMNRITSCARLTVLSVALAAGVPAFAAEPTLNQVYEATHAGRLSEAQGMMTEVLHDHPNSAKAHYVEAEILAKQGRLGEAQRELNRAEELAPGLPFVSQASLRELRGVVAGSSAAQAAGAVSVAPVVAAPAHDSGIPWGLLLVVLAGGLIVYMLMRARRNAAVAPYGAAPVGAGATSYGAPAMGPMGGGIGSGIVGGLVTGAAVGAGMVAGEALAHDLMGGHSSGRDMASSESPSRLATDDLGGQDFGVSDAGSWDSGGGGFDGSGGGGGDWG
jgi:uncharacterized protein